MSEKKMVITLNGKRISRKKAVDLFGERRMERRIKDAHKSNGVMFLDGMAIYFMEGKN